MVETGKGKPEFACSCNNTKENNFLSISFKYIINI